MRTATLFVLMLVASVSIVSRANADLLWDQTQIGTGAYVNQEFSDRPELNSYITSDFTVPAGQNWHITGMTETYSAGSSNWSTVTQGRLNLFPKSAALPLAGNNPASGTLVPISLAPAGGGNFTATATLDLMVAPGAYWISVTPLTNFATNGQAFLHGSQFNFPDDDAIRNPGGGFAYPFGTNWGAVRVIEGLQRWNASMRLDGTVPEPSTLSLLGLALLALRRR